MDRMAVVTEESKLDCLPSTAGGVSLDPAAQLLSPKSGSLTMKSLPNVKPCNTLNASSILNAEKFLKNNVQNSWWSKAYVNDKPKSNHNYSNSAFL